jgi:hypothetical protein
VGLVEENKQRQKQKRNTAVLRSAQNDKILWGCEKRTGNGNDENKSEMDAV